MAIAALLKKPADLLVKPALDTVVPTEYAKWYWCATYGGFTHTHTQYPDFVRTPVCLGWLCKAAAMSVAWFHSRVAFLQLLLNIVKNLIGISSESSQLFVLLSSGG